MERALPLVASYVSSCTGGHRPPSMPAADRPPPDTSGAAPLPPSPVHIGSASWEGSAWRPTVSGHSAALEHATTAPRTVPLRTQAVGTPVAPGPAVRVRSNACGPHTRHRLLDLSSAAARQCAMVRADVAQVQVALLAAAPPLAQGPGMPGDLSPAPWPTPPCASPLACNLVPCSQERPRSRAARYASKVHRTSQAGCQALLRQVCYGEVASWGCRDRRQTPARSQPSLVLLTGATAHVVVPFT
jgi:rare lipoprotein A